MRSIVSFNTGWVSKAADFTGTGAIGFNGQSGSRTLTLTGIGDGIFSGIIGGTTGSPATPNNMKMENRKLPRKDSRNSSRRVWLEISGSPAGFFSQFHMATPPMPKRNQASRNTGNTSTKGLDKAT